LTADFNQRFAKLVAELKNLDDQLAAVVKAGVSKPLVFSHPVYQYFIRRYYLDGEEVHWDGLGSAESVWAQTLHKGQTGHR
jgi:ABC-type Zn uptake system ZnuABC Zn-binding protein ZnuA